MQDFKSVPEVEMIPIAAVLLTLPMTFVLEIVEILGEARKLIQHNLE